MDHKELLDEITKRLDEKIDIIREDLKDIAVSQKDHEVRIVKMESTAGYVVNGLLSAMGLVGTIIAYVIYKFIDSFVQKS